MSAAGSSALTSLLPEHPMCAAQPGGAHSHTPAVLAMWFVSGCVARLIRKERKGQSAAGKKKTPTPAVRVLGLQK